MAVDEFGATLSKLGAMLEKEELQLEATKKRIQAIRSAMEALSSYEVTNDAPAVRRPFKLRVHKRSLAHLVRSQTAEILKERGRPMTRTEIMEQLQERGVSMNVKYPHKRLSKILWDAGEFQNSGNGYWFSNDFQPADTHTTG